MSDDDYARGKDLGRLEGKLDAIGEGVKGIAATVERQDARIDDLAGRVTKVEAQHAAAAKATEKMQADLAAFGAALAPAKEPSYPPGALRRITGQHAKIDPVTIDESDVPPVVVEKKPDELAREIELAVRGADAQAKLAARAVAKAKKHGPTVAMIITAVTAAWHFAGDHLRAFFAWLATVGK